MVVFPAESNPTINILTSLSFPQNARDERELYMRESERPMVGGGEWGRDSNGRVRTSKR